MWVLFLLGKAGLSLLHNCIRSTDRGWMEGYMWWVNKKVEVSKVWDWKSQVLLVCFVGVLYTCAHVDVGMCTSMWRPDVDLNYLPQLLSTFPFEHGTRVHLFVSLAWEWALGIHLSFSSLPVPTNPQDLDYGPAPPCSAFIGMLGIQAQALSLGSKHFTESYPKPLVLLLMLV